MTEPSRGTWHGDGAPPAIPKPSALGWLLVVTRGLGIVSVLLIGVLLILPMRAAERLFAGPRRPVTGPHVQIVCRLCLWILGLRWRREARRCAIPAQWWRTTQAGSTSSC